jgi:ABC-type multidrug transport system fused ATPase/permease subunit
MVMGIFSFLKSNKKTVDKVVDGAISGIDKIFYTNEEKAEARKELAEGVQEFVKTSLNENTARSRTRRVIAIMIMGVFLLLILGAAAAFPFNNEYSRFLFEIVGDMSTFALMVAAFFFGAHMLGRDIVGGKKKKQ